MTLAPLVSALRYRFYLHDHYGREAMGIERPAETIEEAIRKVGADLQLSRTPDVDARALTVKLNTQTRSGFDATITRWENELSLTIAALAKIPEIGNSLSDLDARLQAVDRGYRRKTPDPDIPDDWFDHFDLQIAHLAALASIDNDIRALQESVSPSRLSRNYLPYVIAAVLLLAIGGGAYGLFRALTGGETGTAVATRETAPATTPAASALPATATTPARPTTPVDDSPRVVRTVPIEVPAEPAPAPAPVAAAIDPACRNFTLEVVADGAFLADEPGGGKALAKLEAGEKMLLRRVVAGPAGRRIVEVDVPGRSLRGYLGEADTRLPIMQWTCNQ